jgi:hypothetical protein
VVVGGALRRLRAAGLRTAGLVAGAASFFGRPLVFVARADVFDIPEGVGARTRTFFGRPLWLTAWTGAGGGAVERWEVRVVVLGTTVDLVAGSASLLGRPLGFVTEADGFDTRDGTGASTRSFFGRPLGFAASTGTGGGAAARWEVRVAALGVAVGFAAGKASFLGRPLGFVAPADVLDTPDGVGARALGLLGRPLFLTPFAAAGRRAGIGRMAFEGLPI